MTKDIPFDISIHAPPVKAKAQGSLQAPLRIYCGDGYGTGVTFFCGDHDLAQDLAEAINAVVARHKAKAERPVLSLVVGPTADDVA